jgi:hypothetical protein
MPFYLSKLLNFSGHPRFVVLFFLGLGTALAYIFEFLSLLFHQIADYFTKMGAP